MSRVPSLLLAATVASLLILSASAPSRADWLHYRGPAQNGLSSEKDWNPRFSGDGPKVLWKAQVGKGTSALTVSGTRGYTMGNTGNEDVIYCLDLKTGEPLWTHKYPIDIAPQMFEGGPRATPTIDGNRVYAVSHQGDLWCLDAATGKKIWYTHYQKDHGGRRPEWGFAGSPTVHGQMLLCDVGGSGSSTIALDKSTGKVLWKSGGQQAGYASPIVASIDGQQTVVVFKADALVGLDLKSGRQLWSTDWKTSYDVNAATPLVLGNRIYISSGYNRGGALFQVAGGAITRAWENKGIRAHMNSPVALGGFLYGIDGNAGGGNLVCIEVATGAKKWEEKTVKGGSLISADGKLIVVSEKGELIICEATPDAFKPISRAQVLGGRCWTQPTLDSARLYVRNNEGQMSALDLSK